MKRGLFCGVLLLMCASAHAEPADDPVKVYSAKAEIAYYIAGSGTSTSSVLELQPYYEAAMAGAKNAEQRKAIAQHWGVLKTCAPQAGRLYGEGFDEHQARTQACDVKLAERAAEIEAASYAN